MFCKEVRYSQEEVKQTERSSWDEKAHQRRQQRSRQGWKTLLAKTLIVLWNRYCWRVFRWILKQLCSCFSHINQHIQVFTSRQLVTFREAAAVVFSILILMYFELNWLWRDIVDSWNCTLCTIRNLFGMFLELCQLMWSASGLSRPCYGSVFLK